MKTILKTISIIIFISMFILSCSKNNDEGIDSKYAGTYKGDASIKTLSGVTMCTGTFNVNSDGSVKGNLFNENYKKSYTVSKSNIEKQSDNKSMIFLRRETAHMADYKFIFQLQFLPDLSADLF